MCSGGRGGREREGERETRNGEGEGKNGRIKYRRKGKEGRKRGRESSKRGKKREGRRKVALDGSVSGIQVFELIASLAEHFQQVEVKIDSTINPPSN